ncbi:SidA/IucD/PvdA family monooxygenase [Sutcliffiella horikoshii]|uniref:lysine N(6)-hydroxylase/L-ornithine N(5)-oxygenase family protein n=1 Tax=Sutcliffiella horikoshii TaxID=79883 RepID=UPI00203E6BF9|nr:SidA/IucD/PvdA family monooxygenase [Sutcliffiella horikoshii]MCM3617793.1 SidA/IucD/PvdA family monooxygenase [Sutcliffiella horikoshii]
MTNKIFDLIGIGIGPFNLGLAALTEDLPNLTSLFIDKEKGFNWHPGMLIEQSDLQVPFLADLVTFADPTNKYSFLNYIHKHNRLFPFFFYRRFDIPRREYNLYAKWVSENLSNCRFQSEVTTVSFNGTAYEVKVKDITTDKVSTYLAKHIVVGTGSVPFIPDSINTSEHVVHTSGFLHAAKDIKASSSIIVVGSGQSAAEVFYELLEDQKHHNYSLTWYTRSSVFSQLESAKLGQEVFSPDYVHYFHGLSYEKRKEALERLVSVRNGIDKETLMKIYDLLYNRSVEGRDKKITIQPLTEVNAIKEEEDLLNVTCTQWEKEEEFTVQAEKVVLATGYKPHVPEWIWSDRDDIIWESEKEYKVDEKFRLVWKEERRNHMYVSTNLEHSHGTAATNLGLAVMRNQAIINDVMGKEVYPIQMNNIFQQFMPNE